jgi:hypothetical protein
MSKLDSKNEFPNTEIPPAEKTEKTEKAEKAVSRTEYEAKAAQSTEKNEAIEAAAVAKAPGDYVLYITAKKENSVFEIRAGGEMVRGFRDPSKKYIMFRVPPKVEKSFRMHNFVTTGRIIKAK